MRQGESLLGRSYMTFHPQPHLCPPARYHGSEESRAPYGTLSKGLLAPQSLLGTTPTLQGIVGRVPTVT